jgi:hypothetical protein
MDTSTHVPGNEYFGVIEIGSDDESRSDTPELQDMNTSQPPKRRRLIQKRSADDSKECDPDEHGRGKGVMDEDEFDDTPIRLISSPRRPALSIDECNSDSDENETSLRVKKNRLAKGSEIEQERERKERMSRNVKSRRALDSLRHKGKFFF